VKHYVNVLYVIFGRHKNELYSTRCYVQESCPLKIDKNFILMLLHMIEFHSQNLIGFFNKNETFRSVRTNILR
jgi:hypothetical protein